MPQDQGPTDVRAFVDRDELSAAALLRRVTPLFERWAAASTDSSGPHARNLVQSKVKSLLSFFEFAGKAPGYVSPDDVLAWQRELAAKGLTQTTIYLMLSRLSSFYDWALQHPQVARLMQGNPVAQVRPRPPAPYRNARSLSDDALGKLLQLMRQRIDAGSLVARRDYALLLFYLLTGMSREEIIRLRWGDLSINADGSLLFTTVARGKQRSRQVTDSSLQEALLTYLGASGRLEEMRPDTPLWARHGPAAKPRSEESGRVDTGAEQAGSSGAQLSSKAFEKNMQSYAQAAGLGHIHIQQLRHTFARLAGEELPSLEEARQALGLSDPLSARRYISRVSVERDLMSKRIAARFGLSGPEREADDGAH